MDDQSQDGGQDQQDPSQQLPQAPAHDPSIPQTEMDAAAQAQQDQQAQAQQQAPQQAPPQDGPDNAPDLVSQAQEAHQNQPLPHDQAQGSEDDPRPVGTRGQADSEAQENDPYSRIAATPDEQAQYTQLVTRFILFVHDMRKGSDKMPSPLQQALKLLNNPKLSVPEAVGKTTAMMMFVMHNMAKVQGVSYAPDVMYHAATECCAAIYLIGQARGIFKGTPPFQGMDPSQWQHAHSDQDLKDAGVDQDDYPFTPAEIKIIAKSETYAAQAFGKLMQDHGQLSDDERKDASDFWQQNIRREVQRGVVGKDIMERLQKGGVVDAHAQQQGIAP